MRILSGGIQHETNTFAVTPTTIADFQRDSHFGDELGDAFQISQRFQGTNTIHGGYLQAADELNIEFVPVLNLRAYPSGMVAKDSFEQLVGELIGRIQSALPADGVLLDLHGTSPQVALRPTEEMLAGHPACKWSWRRRSCEPKSVCRFRWAWGAARGPIESLGS